MLLTISGYGKEEHLILYENALTYSKKGYSVIFDRDVMKCKLIPAILNVQELGMGTLISNLALTTLQL